MFPKEQTVLKPKEQKFINIEAPFKVEISEVAIVKILDRKAQNTIILKLKFTQNSAILDVMNSSLETILFSLKEMLQILDLRPMGCNRIKHGILQQTLSKCYIFKLCKQFNAFINTL